MAINIAVEIENVNLDGEQMVVEGRAVADIGDPVELLAFANDRDGIDPGFWAQFILQDNVGRGESQQSAAPVATGCDGSSDLIIAAEQRMNLVHFARVDQFPDAGAADPSLGISIGPDPVGQKEFEVEKFGECFQHAHRAFAVAPKGVVLADDDRHHADFADQDVFDKFTRCQGGKPAGERNDDQDIDIKPLDELDLLI